MGDGFRNIKHAKANLGHTFVNIVCGLATHFVSLDMAV
jgi:hypothetical protein